MYPVYPVYISSGTTVVSQHSVYLKNPPLSKWKEGGVVEGEWIRSVVRGLTAERWRKVSISVYTSVKLTKSPVGIRSGSGSAECAQLLLLPKSQFGTVRPISGSHGSNFHCSPVFAPLFPLSSPILSCSPKSAIAHCPLSLCLIHIIVEVSSVLGRGGAISTN